MYIYIYIYTCIFSGGVFFHRHRYQNIVVRYASSPCFACQTFTWSTLLESPIDQRFNSQRIL